MYFSLTFLLPFPSTPLSLAPSSTPSPLHPPPPPHPPSPLHPLTPAPFPSPLHPLTLPPLPSSKGQKKVFVNGKVNSRFTGKLLRTVKYGCYDDAVVVEVWGRGYYMGESQFWWEEEDELAKGFLVK